MIFDSKKMMSSFRLWSYFFRLPYVLRTATFPFVFMGLGAVLSGCQVSVEDFARPQGPFKLSSPEQNCLTEAMGVLEVYFEGGASARQVEQSWDCASGALTLFTIHARGSQPGVYSDVALRTFFEQHFFGEGRISDQFLTEIMRIKRLILGGESNTVTRSEIARAREIIQILKVESVRLLPHIRVLTQDLEKEDARQNPAAIEAAFMQFQSSLRTVAVVFDQSSQVYELKNLETLMREMMAFYEKFRPWTGPQFVIDQLPMLSALKAFVIRPSGDVIAPQEWSDLLIKGGRIYSIYLRAYYLMSDRPVLSGPGLDQLTSALNEGFALLQEALAAKQNKQIEYAEIDALIDQLYRAKLLTWSVTAPTVKGLARTAFEKVFAPPGRRAYGAVKSSVTGLDAEVLARIQDGLLGWLDMQRLWRDLGAQAIAVWPELARTDGSVGAVPLVWIRQIWPSLETKYRRPFEELKFLFARDLPLTYTDRDAVVFSRDILRLSMNQEAFNSLNWKIAIARVAVLGFASDPEANMFKGLTRAEFKNFFDDARALAIDLQYIERSDNEIWNSTFTEMNLFSLMGDANEELSFAEGIDLISYALSAGKMVGRLGEDLRANCPAAGFDDLGNPSFGAKCFRQRMSQRFTDIYEELTNWADLGRKQKKVGFETLQQLLEAASRRTGYSEASVASSDLTRISMVLHYAEGIFTRFDKDRSGGISPREAKDIFPVFRDVIKRASGLEEDHVVYAVFTYILKHGHPPETLEQKLYFQFVWIDAYSRWKFHADRMQLLRIIAKLKSSV